LRGEHGSPNYTVSSRFALAALEVNIEARFAVTDYDAPYDVGENIIFDIRAAVERPADSALIDASNALLARPFVWQSDSITVDPENKTGHLVITYIAQISAKRGDTSQLQPSATW